MNDFILTYFDRELEFNLNNICKMQQDLVYPAGGGTFLGSPRIIGYTDYEKKCYGANVIHNRNDHYENIIRFLLVHLCEVKMLVNMYGYPKLCITRFIRNT